MRGMELGPGFNPKQEQIETSPEKQNKLLRKLKEFARKLALVGVVAEAGTAAANLNEPNAEKFRAENQPYYEQTLELGQKEQKLRKLFGDYYHYHHAEWSKGFMEDALRKHMEGESIDYLEQISNSSWGEPESLETTQTVATSLDSSEGRITGLRDLIQTAYPRGWVNNEVAFVLQTQDEYKIQESYGLKEGSQALATAGPSKTFPGRSEVVFYKLAKTQPMKYMLEALSHEFGHANDWDSDNELSTGERVDLLLALGERIHSDDRFRSSYAEAITNRNKQLENYNKAREYWAEICRQYFTDYAKLNIKDFQIVDHHVRKSDRNFDLRKSNEEMRKFVAQKLKAKK